MLRLFLLMVVFISSSIQAQTISVLWQQVPGFKPLDVGTHQEVSLWLNERTAKKLGSIILLPDWGNRPTDADAIEPLRQQLPNWGWQTIAITPPQPAERDVLIEGKDTQVIESYQKQLLASLDALDQVRNEQFGYQVVVAQGVMAAWIIRIYAQRQRPLPDALVIIDSYYPNLALNQAIANELTQLTCPVYDLYFRNANNWALSGVNKRRIAMHKAQKSDYRQSEIQSAAYLSVSGNLLAKHLYGWLSSLGWN